MANNCAYCKKDGCENKLKLNTYNGVGKEDVEFYYCSDECKVELQKFSEFVNKNAKKFLIFVLLSIVVTLILIPVGSMVNKYYASIISLVPLVLIGIVLYSYPFATPMTNKWLGIKKAVKLVKTFGISISIFGILFMIVIVAFLK